MFGRKKKTGKSSVSNPSGSQRPLDDLVDIKQPVPPTPQTNTLLRPLEPRIMLDAALTDTLTEAQAVIDTTDFVNRAQELAQVDRQNADLMQGFVPPASINPRVGGVSVQGNAETGLALQSSELQQSAADPSSAEDDPANIPDNSDPAIGRKTSRHYLLRYLKCTRTLIKDCRELRRCWGGVAVWPLAGWG